MASWAYVTATIAFVYFSTVALYRLFLHPLSKFPGPRLAAVTRYFEAYYDIICNGQYTFKIAEMHREYGPIIRISPYEIHVNDPSFYEKIYTRDGRWNKYDWTYDAFGAPGSTICSIDHDVHKRRRAALNAYFSKANVYSKLHIVQKAVKKLCYRMSEFSDPDTMMPFSVGAAAGAFTRDVATEFLLGKAFDNLDNESFNAELAAIFKNSGSLWRITKHIPWYGPMMKSIPSSWVEATSQEGIDRFLAFLKEKNRITTEIFMDLVNGTADPDATRTVIHEVLESDLPPAEKTYERVLDDVRTVTGAAFETTANSIRMTLYQIYTNPPVLRRLRAELAFCAEGKLDEDGYFGLTELEQLPYLTGVLMEGLRFSPAIATRATRVAPDRDLVFGKWTIPAGTPIGMTSYLIHRDPTIYPEPDLFNPDRWLHAEDRWRAEKAFAPFSRGPRNCVGMYLAWAELYMVVAAIVQRFDLTFEESAWDDLKCTSDQFIIGTSGRNGVRARVTKAGKAS